MSDNTAPRFSLAIPCYNEQASLPALIDRLNELLAARSDLECILVDNGSKDSSWDIMRQSAHGRLRIHRVLVNQGYGNGILEGLRQAKGEFIGWTHADLQTDPFDVLLAIQAIEKEGAEFAKGLRKGRPLGDQIFTWGMSIFETMLCGKILWDINAQPTFFAKSFFEAWENPPSDFALDLYAYWLAKKQGLRFARFPVQFPERKHGSSHWNFSLASKIKFIRRTIDFSLRLRFKGIR